jgi:hypothetical protein
VQDSVCSVKARWSGISCTAKPIVLNAHAKCETWATFPLVGSIKGDFLPARGIDGSSIYSVVAVAPQMARVEAICLESVPVQIQTATGTDD